MGWLSVALLALFVVASAADAKAGSRYETVRSGPAEARFGVKAWSFALRERNEGAVLRERPGRGSGADGTLGFRVGEAWQHATRAKKTWRRGRASMLRLATTDPARDLRVAIGPAGKGSIRLSAEVIGPLSGVEAIGMAFRAPKSERYLGFGERSNAVDQRGRVVENWVGEGPYQPEENAIISNAVPKWGMRTTEDATYFPMPWLLSTAGYGVLVENSEPSYFRLGTDRPDTWSVELSRTVEGLDRLPADAPSPGSISLRFFAGPEPADALRRMSAALGRQPPSAPFFFGPWVQPKSGDAETIETLRSRDIPTSVVQTYLHYLPCADQLGREQEQLERTALYHANGLAVTTYFNPMICTSLERFGELAAAGQLTRDRAGDPYVYRYLRYDVGQFDFTSPAARDSYGALLREALAHGYDGWMEDFGEYTPPDAISADGTPGMVEHNRFPQQYHCAAHEQTRSHPLPVLRFIRSGFTGAAACAPVVWGGDPSTSWGFDGLRSSIQNGLTMGLSGVGVWGSDIGGFFSIASDPLSPELLSRWVQFGAFSGVMRSQADGLQIDDRYRPQVLDPDQIGNWRRYAKLRTQLFPYVSAAAADYRRTGMPMMRAMVLHYPDDRRASALEDQYMFGPDLLVAPVIEPGATTRQVYLPKGRWVDLWRSVEYGEADGAFRLVGGQVLRGGRWVTLPAPSEEIPVLARAGALITTLLPDVATLSPYEADESVVNLEDRPGRQLMAFPRGRSEGRFEQSGRLTSVERDRVWRLDVEDTQARPWRIRATTASMRKPFAVRCARIGKRPIGRDSWSFQDGLLEVELPAAGKRFRLSFSARPC